MSTTRPDDHICATQAVCFQCFKAGMERVRARRDAWAQRALPASTTDSAAFVAFVAHGGAGASSGASGGGAGAGAGAAGGGASGAG